MIYSYFPPKMWTCPKTRKPNHFLMGGNEKQHAIMNWKLGVTNKRNLCKHTQDICCNTYQSSTHTLYQRQIFEQNVKVTKVQLFSRSFKFLIFPQPCKELCQLHRTGTFPFNLQRICALLPLFEGFLADNLFIVQYIKNVGYDTCVM